mmetsp:Transcript_17677/g.31996  ORF Transcript_17677/g.31996 Transcript_17677/m.31996 type:complete len:181 (-) Transcript_17677:61-603(-)
MWDNREIVLQLCQQESLGDGMTLEVASRRLRNDREIVLAAVMKDGACLEWASELLRNDRDIVLAAVTQDSAALQWAGDEVLQDEHFAVEARRGFRILRINTLSGQSTYVPLLGTGPQTPLLQAWQKVDVIWECCRKLGMQFRGTEKLLQGTVEVSDHERVEQWPGMGPLGTVTEYQLVVM